MILRPPKKPEFLMNPYRFSTGGGSSTDFYFANLKLLLEYDGTNGQTTFTDFAPNPSAVSSNNSAAVSTTQQKFGTGSLLLNGTNQYVSSNRICTIGVNQFTIESHIRPTAAQVGRIFSVQNSTTTNAVIFFRVNADGSLQIFLRNTAGTGTINLSTAAGLIAMNDTVWYHVAVTRNSAARIDIWVDGVSVANTTAAGTDPTNGSNTWVIGSQYGTAEFFKGYLDNTRVTENVCRYTTTFSPPTAAYPHVGPSGIESFSTGVTALHCLKRKWTGYSGSCIRIRRSSDSTEQDIGFVSTAINAAADSAAAIAFCGAGDGLVTTIYDQSGNGNNWIQATAAKQPQIVAAGVWNGSIVFDASNDSMASVNNCGVSSVYHIGALFAKRSWGAGTDCIFFDRGVWTGTENGNSMTYASGTAFPWRLWKSANIGAGNYISNGVASASDPVRPTLGHAVWGEMDYGQSTITVSLRHLIGSVQQTSAGTTTAGTVGTSTVGSAVKHFLGARNNASFFADMNWFGDILAEGAIPDSSKISMQAILES